jgi:hypothetical protein
MARLVITKEKEDSPVPWDLPFEKGEKAVVPDVADVAKGARYSTVFLSLKPSYDGWVSRWRSETI